MKQALTYLLAPKESKETLSGLVSLAGGLIGAGVTNSLKSSNWMAVLTGNTPASPRERQVARTLLSMRDNPDMMDGLLNMGMEWLSNQGHDTQRVLKMVRDYAPLVNIKLTDASIPSLRDGMLELAERIENSDDTPDVNAVVVCPYCTEMFTV